MKKLFRLPVSGSAKTFLECRIMLILQNYIFLTVEDELGLSEEAKSKRGRAPPSPQKIVKTIVEP